MDSDSLTTKTFDQALWHYDSFPKQRFFEMLGENGYQDECSFVFLECENFSIIVYVLVVCLKGYGILNIEIR